MNDGVHRWLINIRPEDGPPLSRWHFCIKITSRITRELPVGRVVLHVRSDVTVESASAFPVSSVGNGVKDDPSDEMNEWQSI